MAALILAAAALPVHASAAEAPEGQRIVRIPPATGRYHVGTAIAALTDDSRREPRVRPPRPRSIVVQLWYPTERRHGPTAAYLPPAVAKQIGAGIPGGYRTLLRARTGAFLGAPAIERRHGWPVVVFSPGYGVESRLYTGLVEDLASRGFVVIAVDHPQDANVVTFPDGHTVVRQSAGETPATIRRALATRVADIRFLLDQLESRASIAHRGPGRADLDMSRVGMFGHSLGGATAADVMLADPRVRAGADLDGTVYGAAGRHGLARPFMIMAGSPGPLREPGMRRFFLRLRGPRLAITLKDAGHFAFSDLLFLLPVLVAGDPRLERAAAQLTGKVPASATLARERRDLAAFFDRYLKRSPVASSQKYSWPGGQASPIDIDGSISRARSARAG